MTLRTSLTSAEFETADAGIKGFYIKNGDGYKLDADYEDVAGLKKSKETILTEKKQLEAKLAELERFKLEHETKADEAEKERQKKAGEFEQLEKTMKERFAQREQQLEAEKSSILQGYKQKELALTLLSKGVRKEYVDLATLKLNDRVDVEAKDGALNLRIKNGIGDAKEFDNEIEGLKSAYPDLFEPTNARGSGASQSNGNASAPPKTLSKAQVAALDQTAKREFYLAGGSVEN